MSAAEWIAKRRELLDAATVGSSVSAQFVMDARTSIPRALDALEAVLELHEMGMRPTSMHYNCEPLECDQAGDGELRAECEMCGEWWPCPTATAIRAALLGGDDE